MALIKFHELEVDPKKLLETKRMVGHFWYSDWTRVEIPLESYMAVGEIADWIEENLEGSWGYIQKEQKKTVFDNGKDKKKYQYYMVLGFELENDALMFKLMGGHETD